MGNSFLPTFYANGRAINEMQRLESEVEQIETVGITMKTLKCKNSYLFE